MDQHEIIKKYVAVANKIPTKPGCWDYLKVDILCDGVKVGEYSRNYSSLFNTFCPFVWKGKEYALYSRHYTATRLMSLPDCKDLGGEEPGSGGFCPTGYAVPIVPMQSPEAIAAKPKHNPRRHPEQWPDDKAPEFKEACARFDAEYNEWWKQYPFEEQTCPFALMCGCHWGDDCSWKLQLIDLRRVEEGIITRKEAFGYIEFWGAGKDLAELVDVSEDEGRFRVKAATISHFDLDANFDGKLLS